jgi:hypothetical protein
MKKNNLTENAIRLRSIFSYCTKVDKSLTANIIKNDGFITTKETFEINNFLRAKSGVITATIKEDARMREVTVIIYEDHKNLDKLLDIMKSYAIMGKDLEIDFSAKNLQIYDRGLWHTIKPIHIAHILKRADRKIDKYSEKDDEKSRVLLEQWKNIKHSLCHYSEVEAKQLEKDKSHEHLKENLQPKIRKWLANFKNRNLDVLESPPVGLHAEKELLKYDLDDELSEHEMSTVDDELDYQNYLFPSEKKVNPHENAIKTTLDQFKKDGLVEVSDEDALIKLEKQVERVVATPSISSHVLGEYSNTVLPMLDSYFVVVFDKRYKCTANFSKKEHEKTKFDTGPIDKKEQESLIAKNNDKGKFSNMKDHRLRSSAKKEELVSIKKEVIVLEDSSKKAIKNPDGVRKEELVLLEQEAIVLEDSSKKALKATDESKSFSEGKTLIETKLKSENKNVKLKSTSENDLESNILLKSSTGKSIIAIEPELKSLVDNENKIALNDKINKNSDSMKKLVLAEKVESETMPLIHIGESDKKVS